MKKIKLIVIAAFVVATASAFTTKLSRPFAAVEGYLPGNPCTDVKPCSDNSSHPICKDINSNQLFGLNTAGTTHPCQLTVYQP